MCKLAEYKLGKRQMKQLIKTPKNLYILNWTWHTIKDAGTYSTVKP